MSTTERVMDTTTRSLLTTHHKPGVGHRGLKLVDAFLDQLAPLHQTLRRVLQLGLELLDRVSDELHL